MEYLGYELEAAEGTFALLVSEALHPGLKFFDVESYRTSVERRHNARGEQVVVTEAVVKIRIGDDLLMSVAEGNGRVRVGGLVLDRSADAGDALIGVDLEENGADAGVVLVDAIGEPAAGPFGAVFGIDVDRANQALLPEFAVVLDSADDFPQSDVGDLHAS